MQKAYTTFDIERLLGISRNRLQQWLDGRFVSPSVRAAGVGTKNLFSREDLYDLVFFQALLGCGLSRDEARGLVYAWVPLEGKITISREFGFCCVDFNAVKSWVDGRIV